MLTAEIFQKQRCILILLTANWPDTDLNISTKQSSHKRALTLMIGRGNPP